MGAAAIRAGQAFVEISARDQKLKQSLEVNKQRMQQFVKTAAVVGSAIAIAASAQGIRAASNLEEVMNKFNVVFGESRDEMKKWGDEFAAQVGRSKRQAADFLASTQNLLVPIGFDADTAKEASKQITKLAVDVASLENKADADVLRDFHSAITGSGETVKKYGVVLNVATTNQRLLQDSIDPRNATEAQKAWARYQVILEGTTSAQGDAIRSSGSYANQVKRLEGAMEDLSGELGSILLPAATALVKLLNSGITPVIQWVKENAELVKVIGALAIGVGVATVAFKALGIAMTIYAQRAAIAQALSGPKGIAFLAVAVGAAVIAIEQINDLMDDMEKKAAAAADAQNELAAAMDNVAKGEKDNQQRNAINDARLKNIQAIRDAFLGTLTPAQQLAVELEKVRKAAQGQDVFTDAQVNLVMERMINQASGFGAEMRRVRDEIGLVNGTLTDSAIRLREMQQLGLPAEQVQQMRQAFAALEAAKDRRKQKEEAERQKEKQAEELKRKQEQKATDQKRRADEIRKNLQSPQEKTNALFAELQELIRAGALEREAAQQFLNKQIQGFENQQRQAAASFRQESSADLRTSEGVSLLSSLLNGNQAIDRKLLTVGKKTADNTGKIAEAFDGVAEI